MSSSAVAAGEPGIGASFYQLLSRHPYVCAFIVLLFLCDFRKLIEYYGLAVLGVMRLVERVYDFTLGRLFATPLRYLPKDRIKRVAVIGAGASGITAAKEALNAGFDVTVFEQTSVIGGNWVFRETETHASVYRSTFINTSKQMMNYSDYPMPNEFPTYPSHEQIVTYFRSYAQHFGVTKCVRFQTQVLDVSLSKNGDGTSWDVTHVPSPDQKPLYLRAAAGENPLHSSSGVKPAVDTFDAVFVANGHHSVPRWPSPAFAGQSTFKGHIMHSHSYKDPSSCGRGYDFHNKRVVVVGIGNSGVDIANELSHCVAKEVYLSTRSGAWIWPKFITGNAFDHVLTPPRWKIEVIPKRLRDNLVLLKQAMKPVEQKIFNHFGDQTSFGLRAPTWLLGAHPTISEELLHRIGTGTIRVVPDIQSIDTDSVTFTDGTRVGCDVIVFCTGYHISFPFLKPEYQPTRTNRVSTTTGLKENKTPDAAATSSGDHKDASDPLGGNGVDAYKAVFSPHLPPTLVHIGLFQPLGAIMPISEMQSRWACGVWKGILGLPNPAEMQKDCDAFAAHSKERYLARPRHTIQRDGVTYLPELASLVGCEPNMFDPRNWSILWLLLVTPAGWPTAFRLSGPDVWSGAKNALRVCWNQISAPKIATAHAGVTADAAVASSDKKKDA